MAGPSQPRNVVLREQNVTEVPLMPSDAEILRSLNFEVLPARPVLSCVTELLVDHNWYAVNPKQYVGHLALQSGLVVIVEPKIDPAAVFRMLGYVYASWDRDVFRQAEVLYSTDELVFEPLVKLFNELVTMRVRRGLVQDYVRHEENLGIMRGRVMFNRQVPRNLARPDRLFCRYSERTADVEDNQLLKWTLRHLAFISGLSDSTNHAIRANLRHFSEVSLPPIARELFYNRVYHRMNEDYRLLHDLCRLFLEHGAITEKAGDWSFRGFLLDMNQLFEAFVTTAFTTMAKFTRLSAHPQKEYQLSIFSSRVNIRPDVTLHHGSTTVSIVDAKYKKLEGDLKHHDLYQMVAYGTALQCNRGYLFYPASEWECQAAITIQNSSITVHIRRVDIGHRDCVSLLEQAANKILDEAQTPSTFMPIS